jgi:DNA-binding MarR family transcriptional regulator
MLKKILQDRPANSPLSSASTSRWPKLVQFNREVPLVRRIPIALARRFFQICNTAAAVSLADTELTPLQFAVMAYLNSDVGQPDIDQNSLAARLGIDRASASQLVDQLEAKGLLERRVNGHDRRARLLRLTARGEKLHRRVRPQAIAGQDRILADLSPAERELLIDLLVRIIASNWDLARPGAARRKPGAGSADVQ